MTKLLYKYALTYYFLFGVQFSLFSAIRDIFQYDTDWCHADYEIIAQGHFHETGKAFKMLNYAGQSKIVAEE